MIYGIAAIALVIVVFFFLNQRRQRQANDVWISRRRQRAASRKSLAPARPVDPNFQFEAPAPRDESKQREP